MILSILLASAVNLSQPIHLGNKNNENKKAEQIEQKNAEEIAKINQLKAQKEFEIAQKLLAAPVSEQKNIVKEAAKIEEDIEGLRLNFPLAVIGIFNSSKSENSYAIFKDTKNLVIIAKNGSKLNRSYRLSQVRDRSIIISDENGAAYEIMNGEGSDNRSPVVSPNKNKLEISENNLNH